MDDYKLTDDDLALINYFNHDNYTLKEKEEFASIHQQRIDEAQLNLVKAQAMVIACQRSIALRTAALKNLIT